MNILYKIIFFQLIISNLNSANTLVNGIGETQQIQIKNNNSISSKSNILKNINEKNFILSKDKNQKKSTLAIIQQIITQIKNDPGQAEALQSAQQTSDFSDSKESMLQNLYNSANFVIESVTTQNGINQNSIQYSEIQKGVYAELKKLTENNSPPEENSIVNEIMSSLNSNYGFLQVVQTSKTIPDNNSQKPNVIQQLQNLADITITEITKKYSILQTSQEYTQIKTDVYSQINSMTEDSPPATQQQAPAKKESTGHKVLNDIEHPIKSIEKLF
jgi:hypothetical protein